MISRVAIGIGCRKGCAGEAIAALVRRALAQAGAERGAALFTAEEKRGETGLAEAAAALGLPLIFLTRARLAATAPRCETRSARVEALFGVPSLAEAAALAGAGASSRLIVKRISEGGATCAVAYPAEDSP